MSFPMFIVTMSRGLSKISSFRVSARNIFIEAKPSAQKQYVMSSDLIRGVYFQSISSIQVISLYTENVCGSCITAIREM